MTWPDEIVEKVARELETYPYMYAALAKSAARSALDAIADDVVLRSEMREERQRYGPHEITPRVTDKWERRLVTEWEPLP